VVSDSSPQNLTKSKTILLISSHVVRGSVGSRVSSFVLERLGFAVWSLLTISLTWQPRQGQAHVLRVSEADFAGFCADIAASPSARDIDAVMSGYFASPQQVASAALLIERLKADRPDITYLCDPVMADEGGLYIATDIAQAIKAQLLPIADIIKPNRSELEWIGGRSLDNNASILAALAPYKATTKLVTSAIAQQENATGNLLINEDGIWLAEHPSLATPVNGLGDLTATLFFSHLLHSMPAQLALEKTTASVFDCLQHAIKAQADELLLPEAQDFFTRPVSPITITPLQC